MTLQKIAESLFEVTERRFVIENDVMIALDHGVCDGDLDYSSAP